MNHKSIISLIVIILLLGFSKSNEFRSPVNGILRLSGTFGELKHNHFHAGIDIKSSNGRPGDPIFAIANGHVSRIRMSASGYGNAVYIEHPNGYTSVYAHLNDFNQQLTDYIRKYQERHETFEIEIYPSTEHLKMKRGEMIGHMGNTGSSAGVHLHFEIRDTETESPINPLHWKFNYVDDHNPFASRLYIYQIKEGPIIEAFKNLKLGGAYHDRSPYPSSIQLPEGKYGLGIKAFDPFNSWRNRNGIYQVSLLNNDSLIYQFTMDSIPFHLSKYINTHIDHEHYCTQKSLRHRLFKLELNKAPIYNTYVSDGTFEIKEDDTLKYKIVISDFEGRKSKVHFTLHGTQAEQVQLKKDSFSTFIPVGKDTSIYGENCSIRIPPHAFFEGVHLSTIFKKSADSLPVIDLEENCDAIYQGIDYRFHLAGIPDSLRNKTHIGKLQGSRIKDCGGHWKGEQLKARINELGQFSVYIDTTAPKINYLYGRFNSGRTLTFRITNETLSKFRHIDLGYAVYLNENWHYATFDKRTMRLKTNLPSTTLNDSDTLVIKAWDRLGNTSYAQFPL